MIVKFYIKICNLYSVVTLSILTQIQTEMNQENQQLVDALILQIKIDLKRNDVTAIEEMFRNLAKNEENQEIMKSYLPEIDLYAGEDDFDDQLFQD